MKLWWIGPAIGLYLMMNKKEEKKKPITVKRPVAPVKPVVIAVNEQDEDTYEMD